VASGSGVRASITRPLTAIGNGVAERRQFSSARPPRRRERFDQRDQPESA
jgi:hypothetical protein